MATVFAHTPTGSTSKSALDTVKEQGYLTLCSDPDNKPFSNSAGTPSGFQIDLANEVARDIGVELRYHWFAQNFSHKLFKQIDQGKCDIIFGLPGVKDFIRNSRKLVFSAPYYQGGFALVTPKDTPIKSFSDLKGKKIGVEMGTVPDIRFSREHQKRVLFTNAENAVKAVREGKVDASVVSSMVAGWLIKNNYNDHLTLLNHTREDLRYPITFAVKKGADPLLLHIQSIIKNMKKDGRFQKIMNKFGVVSLRDEAQATNVATLSESESASASTIEHGRKLYKQACFKCHGPKGVSGGTIPDVRHYVGNDAQFLTLVSDGRNAMPPWKDILGTEKIKQIRAYIVHLPK